MDMGDYFDTAVRTNKQVLARTADGVSTSAVRVALELHRQDRKFNSGTPAQAKPGEPWYRRFDKR